MTEPPFQEDFFQRIVNVKWGGKARFMFGTFYYNRPYSSDDGKTWTAAADGGDSGVYAGMWCRIGGKKNPGKSIWLMGIVQHLRATILYSEDGRNYTTIDMGAEGSVSGVYRFSYDVETGLMYAAAYVDNGEAEYHLYTSTDGKSWGGGGAASGTLPGLDSQDATEETMKYAQISGAAYFGEGDYISNYTSAGRLKDGKLYQAKVGSQNTVVINGASMVPFPSPDDITYCIAFGVGTDGPVFVVGGSYHDNSNLITPDRPAIAWSTDGRSWSSSLVAEGKLTAFVTAMIAGPYYSGSATSPA